MARSLAELIYYLSKCPVFPTVVKYQVSRFPRWCGKNGTVKVIYKSINFNWLMIEFLNEIYNIRKRKNRSTKLCKNYAVIHKNEPRG